jgi:hypothetical protein
VTSSPFPPCWKKVFASCPTQPGFRWVGVFELGRQLHRGPVGEPEQQDPDDGQEHGREPVAGLLKRCDWDRGQIVHQPNLFLDERLGVLHPGEKAVEPGHRFNPFPNPRARGTRHGPRPGLRTATGRTSKGAGPTFRAKRKTNREVTPSFRPVLAENGGVPEILRGQSMNVVPFVSLKAIIFASV